MSAETGSSKDLLLRRVKVYILDEAWVDNGTGYCFGELNEDDTPFLVVRNEQNQDEVLLESKVEGNITFQRQQETLIVWTDLDGKNIALSFQEKEGCISLCDFIIKIQRSEFAPQISLVTVIATDSGNDITELITGPINYPPLEPKISDLPNIINILNENPNSSYQKQSIGEFLKKQNYLVKLIDIFNYCEKNHQIKNLHLLCNIIKILVLYNESSIIELILEDENLLGVVGILEYDSSFPEFKFNHRSFLKDDNKFKEVIKINNNYIKNLIKRTFKLQFLKDVVLSRLLDDPTFNLISTLIHFNQIEIIKFLEHGKFINKLFKIYSNGDETDINLKKDGIKLLYQFILIAKNLQSPQKTSFFKSLIKKGLFKTINFVIHDNSTEIKVIATEIIVTIIEHDVLLVNAKLDDGEDANNDNEIDESDDDYGYDPDEDEDEEDEDYKEGESDGDDEDDEAASDGDDEEADGESDEEHHDEKNGNDDVPKMDHVEDKEEHISIGNQELGTVDKNDEEDDDFYNSFERNEFTESFVGNEKITLSDDMTLLKILSNFLIEDNDNGLKMQAFEALKSLLDPFTSFQTNYLGQEDTTSLDYLNTTNYFNAFYSQVAKDLFKPLIDLIDGGSKGKSNANDSLFIYLIELIIFCSKDKVVSRSFFLENQILLGVNSLISSPNHNVQVKLTAIRCFKSIILLNDDYYTRYLISNNLFTEIFKFFDLNLSQSNLINSTVLDLIEIILIGLEKNNDKKNFKLLANHIVKNFKKSLDSINCISSGDDLIKFVEQELGSNISSSYIDPIHSNNINQEEVDDDDIMVNDNSSENSNNDNIENMSLKKKKSLKDKLTKFTSKFTK